MTNELKKCPFCWSEVEMHRGVYSQYIMCRNKECEAMSLSNMDGAVVLKAWNTRPIEDALRAENERLRDVLREMSEGDITGYQVDVPYYTADDLQQMAKQALETKGGE